MSTLLPAPLGEGTRNNDDKRLYVLANITDIEYRTITCKTKAEAKQEQDRLKLSGRKYLFGT